MPAREDVLALRRVGDEFVGQGVVGRGNRIFGGVTLAHAVSVAEVASGSARRINALHAIFVSPGDARQEIRYRAAPVKRGRSIDVISVDAVQSDRVILTAHVTFHDGSPSPQFHDRAPQVTPPSALSADDQLLSPGGARVRAPFDVRSVPRDGEEPRQDTWIRLRDETVVGRNQDAAYLAYAMDFLITRPAHVPLDPETVSLFGASLDHAMWFHRPFDVTRWLLVSSRASSFATSRSFCHSQVFDEDGRLVASGTQEALLPATGAIQVD